MFLIVLIFFALIFSAFFSGAEIAFVSANKLGIELKKAGGSRRGKILAGFFEKPQSFLGTMLVGNNIALVAFTLLMTALVGPFLKSFIDPNLNYLHLLLNTIVITLVVLVFGEYLPKVFFRVYANEILYSITYPLLFVKNILAFPAWIMTSLSNVLLKQVFRTSMEPVKQVLTRLDLEDYVKTTASGGPDEIETEMFNKALNLKEVKVRDCMVPRTEIIHVDVGENVNVLKKAFAEKRHSRVIISDGDIDTILGYVHHQHLLAKPSSIRKAMNDIPIVPEVLNVRDLMMQFIRERVNIAVVVDEFGGTSGLITLEDMLEEIFGEIEDEYDSEDLLEIELAKGEFRLSGRLEIDYLNEKYEEFDLPKGDYHTLSGYLVTTSGTIPEQGDEIEIHEKRFVLEKVSEKKIEVIRVYFLSKED